MLVVSGDRDTIQLVDDDVTLLYPNARGVSQLKVYRPDAVRERYGIEPEQYPEIAALVGETSDNLSGVDKVGEDRGQVDPAVRHRGRGARAPGRDRRGGRQQPA